MAEYIRAFDPSHGMVGAETTPGDQNAMYASPDELAALYNCEPSEGDIRAAMTIIHTHCNRPSLWPTEYRPPAIRIPEGRQEFRIPVTPVIKVLELSARFGYGRRDHRSMGINQSVMGAMLLMSGGRPAWTTIEPDTCEVEASTGIVFLADSLWFQPYSLVKVRAVCGYLQIPDRAKLAMFELINSMHAKGVSDRIAYGVGRVTRRYASDSFITPFAKELLAPFVVQSLM